jgi:hypothetical protein
MTLGVPVVNAMPYLVEKVEAARHIDPREA